MFSHCMKRQGQQHYWLPPRGHMTRVMWLRRTWPVGLAADGHLNRACPRGRGPLIWEQEEERRWPSTTSNVWSLLHTRLQSRRYSGMDGTGVTRTQMDTHTPTCMLECMHTVQHRWMTRGSFWYTDTRSRSGGAIVQLFPPSCLSPCSIERSNGRAYLRHGGQVQSGQR